MYLSLLAYLFNDWRSLARAIALTPGNSDIFRVGQSLDRSISYSRPPTLTDHAFWPSKLYLVIPVIISFFTLVESPRWLLNKNKEAEANKGGFLN